MLRLNYRWIPIRLLVRGKKAQTALAASEWLPPGKTLKFVAPARTVRSSNFSTTASWTNHG